MPLLGKHNSLTPYRCLLHHPLYAYLNGLAGLSTFKYQPTSRIKANDRNRTYPKQPNRPSSIENVRGLQDQDPPLPPRGKGQLPTRSQSEDPQWTDLLPEARGLLLQTRPRRGVPPGSAMCELFGGARTAKIDGSIESGRQAEV